MLNDSPENAFASADKEMRRVLELQRQAFSRDMNPSRDIRLDRLNRLLRMTRIHAPDIVAAISKDYGDRSPHQTYLAEIFVIAATINHTKRHLRSWMRTRRAPTALQYRPAYNRIMRQPLGVVGIISPWNYPYQLAMAPAIGALAAGNRVMIKPSELTPNLSALLKKIVGLMFSEDEMAVVTGDADVGKSFSALPFDHLVFTGSTAVGRLIAQEAAKNLTPVTLELGGKSPVIVDASADLAMAATRIANTKLFNGGQTCVAPDYVLLPEGRTEDFIAAFRVAVATMYPRIGDNPDYTSIINDRHFNRLQSLVDDAREKGAGVVTLNPGNEPLDRNKRKFLPTIVLNPDDAMRVMQDEIFGPILPILTYATIDEAIDYINRHARPLALYWIGASTASRDNVLRNTISGGVTINDCMWHFGQEDVPFGGVGASGSGAYHGEYGFLTLSKEKPVFYQSRWNWLQLLAPPYGKTFDRLMRVLKRIA
jgi:coniferyl-aldehyde dehydrogenase